MSLCGIAIPLLLLYRQLPFLGQLFVRKLALTVSHRLYHKGLPLASHDYPAKGILNLAARSFGGKIGSFGFIKTEGHPRRFGG